MARSEREKASRDSSASPNLSAQGNCPRKLRYLSGRRILPEGIRGTESISRLLDISFFAYNSGRLAQGCRLFAGRMLEQDVTVGMSIAGALTPAGAGCSCIVPLIRAGFVDWIVSTGANLYHDLHFAFNCPLHVGTHHVDDADLKRNDVVRIYDIFLGHTDCLMATDRILDSILKQREFQKEMGTAEFHYLLGRHAAEWEEKNGHRNVSVLAAAYRCDVPVYTSSPGDSALGMTVAGLELEGAGVRINPSVDVNETASLVLHAKKDGGKSGVLLIGGGSPKNFVLQTEPQIQEILHIREVGHDYFLQFTDARPDTGGLSGATPHEAVSWGKVDPDRLPDAVVCYLDSTVALPILTHYALSTRKRRPLKRLYLRREELVRAMTEEFFRHNPDKRRSRKG